jgi:hypothetical protein
MAVLYNQEMTQLASFPTNGQQREANYYIGDTHKNITGTGVFPLSIRATAKLSGAVAVGSNWIPSQPITESPLGHPPVAPARSDDFDPSEYDKRNIYWRLENGLQTDCEVRGRYCMGDATEENDLLQHVCLACLNRS